MLFFSEGSGASSHLQYLKLQGYHSIVIEVDEFGGGDDALSHLWRLKP